MMRTELQCVQSDTLDVNLNVLELDHTENYFEAFYIPGEGFVFMPVFGANLRSHKPRSGNQVT